MHPRVSDSSRAAGVCCPLQVADGHHQHHVSELVCEELEGTLLAAAAEQPDLEEALVRRAALCCWQRAVAGATSGAGQRDAVLPLGCLC